MPVNIPLKKKEVLVTSSINNNNVFVSIKDYGIGIPEEDQKKIFSQFFRAGNVQNIQGTGLGLAIVSRMLN
jgi:signal transduction histidine kinase